MAGMAAGCTLLALALCPKEKEGGRDRRKFARSAFVATIAGCMLSGTTLVVMKLAQAL